MPKAESSGKLEATISAKIIRADGTEEDIGVISSTSADAEAVIAALRTAAEAGDVTRSTGGEMTLEEVNALHAERSEENDARSEAARRADHEAHLARLDEGE